MKLGLIRHAEAATLERAGVRTDSERPLTPLGEQQAEALAAALVRLDLRPAAILTSPLLRARQTAAILAAGFSNGKEPIVCEWLGLEESRFKKLSREAAQHGPGLVLLIGHMPNLADYAAWLIGAEAGAIDFSKAAMGLISFPGVPAKAAGELKWLVPPAWFLQPSTTEVYA